MNFIQGPDRFKMKTKERQRSYFYSVRGINHQSTWSERLPLGKFRLELLHLVGLKGCPDQTAGEEAPGMLQTLSGGGRGGSWHAADPVHWH
jgi:hypothetical protein